MSLFEVFGDFEYIYNFGPSSLGNGIIDVKGVQDFVRSKFIGSKRLNQDESLDNYLVLNRNRFFSGKIYSFLYDGKGPDMHPMFMSITNKIAGGDKLFEIGININYLHPKDRAKLFKAIVSAFPNQLQRNIEHIKNGDREQADLPLTHKEMRNNFFDLIEINPRLIKIDRSKIMKDTIRVVPYEYWKYLIYYLPVTFVNTNLSTMYKEE